VQVTGSILSSVDVSVAPQPVVEQSRPTEIPSATVPNTQEYITYKRQPRAKKVIRANSTTDASSDPSQQVSVLEVSAVLVSASASAPETVIYTDQ
jgi:hypothetical protein